ncbi:kinesin-like protein KIF20B isoform X3 [Coregonus clupeaformis]|uniref:kinesin-like protein KIF20B isoform X3 n=1 Tax=Coregonus clupeaformis TaxID=59861 RepID=UPI001E1C64A8|nr:kinesin-like protein KIF20B isoform X3 [Coregonus clupeaformis]
MMESCFHNKLESVEREMNVDDLRKDLSSEFHSQESYVEESEHLQVYLRIRPFTSTESENGESQDCVSIEPPDTVLLKAPRTSLSARLSDKSAPQTAQRFQFSQVFGPETSQREMFDGTVRSLVKEVLEGGNSLVFTYGVTNAGKTFTFLGPEANAGILPRSLNVIFNNVEGRVYNQMTIKPQRCREFIRLTKDQQSEEATSKRNLFRLLKEGDNQKSTISQTSSTSKTTLEGSTLSDVEGTVTEDRFSLVVDAHTKFSVWVSFCEIYNENIHDLLEPIPNGALKRTTLRLSQDVKGNSFVKDLKWVQVNNAEEAYKVMKLGEKNQSFASTKLNLLSSRSHSIFSVRILRIEDARIPRVNSISELTLCDLAGSERCAKTQNKGERLKEAGNINTSLMTLGKCINALRQRQQSKLPQHVPFRESKLTHYLQGFFCGRGKACMVVNVNQCASLYDETLNVLKFSAVAQKVVVLTTKTVPHLAAKRSARELSMIINNNADGKNLLGQRRRSSLVGWETSLEDVDEDVDREEEEESTTEDSVMEETMQEVEDDKFLIDKDAYENQLLQLKALREQLQKERSENLALESRIRDEVIKEFSELFSEMQTDYKERLAKEKEIVEERAERRLEILKNLVNKNTSQEELDRADRELDGADRELDGADRELDGADRELDGADRELDGADRELDGAERATKDSSSLGGMFDSMCSDLAGIKKAAEEAKTCLVVTHPGSDTISNQEKRAADLSEQLSQANEQFSVKTNELENYCGRAPQSNEQFEEARKTLESQELKFSHLLEMCREKDEIISKLQNTMDQQVKATVKDTTFDGIKDEILRLKSSCTCSRAGKPSSRRDSRKRLVDLQQDLEEQPPSKKGFLEECSGEEEKMDRLRWELEEKSSDVAGLVETLQLDLVAHGEGDWKVQEWLEVLADNSSRMEARDLEAELEGQTGACEEAPSVEEEVRRENARLLQEDWQREMSALRRESQDLTGKLQAMEREVSLQTARADQAAEDRRATRDHEVREKTALIDSLTQEVTRLRQEVVASQAASGVQRNSGLLRDKMAELKRECSEALEERLLLKEKLAQLQISEQELKEKLAQQQISEQELKEKLAQQQISEQELKEKLSQQQISEQELVELKEKLAQQQISEQELGELKEKLAQQQISEQELKEKLAQQQISEQELKEKLAQQQISEQELKEKLAQQQISEQELKEKLAQQQISEQELKEKLAKQQISEQELKEKLAQQQISEQELKEKLAQQELTLEQLRAEMEEAKAEAHIDSENSVAESETAEGLRKLNSDLQAEVTTLKGRMADLEEKERTRQTEREAELEKKLIEKEAQVSGLQKSLREAQEVREDEETAAVQEARRREVERRRELLAVAEEAIAQKDAELEKRAQDITRLKDMAKLDSDKVRSLSQDLERKGDDNSDLREKLADSKKQIQQVQTEIISKREEEKSLKLKLQDLEKVKKQQQADLANKDRTINQLKTEQFADSKSDENLQLYQNACKDLQAKERLIEDMRLALTEQEDTQTQQEQVLEAKLEEIDALVEEVEKVKGLLRYQDSRKDTAALGDGQLDEAKLAKQEAVQAQVTLKLCTEKHLADRRKWLEEKMVLIRLAKEAEDKRNQEMRKFADGRERHAKQQTQVEALSARLGEKERDLLKWREERDSLVAALEVQLTKLLSSIADKDEQIASLRCNATSQPAECGQVEVEQLQGLLSERGAEILNLKEQLKAASKASSHVSAPPPTKSRETATLTKAEDCPPKVNERTLHDNRQLGHGVKTEKRTSQGSGDYPSVLDSSEISTEGGRTSRFPKPELEISFSPLQPNRMALKRQGEDVINVKITRKRKSAEIDKKKFWHTKAKQRSTHEFPSQDEVTRENRRNTRSRLTPKLAVHQEEPSPSMDGKDLGSMRPQDSQSSLRSRKEGTMQKFGDFLQSSPTFFGSKAKKIMGLVSGKSPETEGGASMSFRPKKSKRKLYRPEISTPMDFPSHPIISGVPDERESDHLIIKRKLRTRTAK